MGNKHSTEVESPPQPPPPPHPPPLPPPPRVCMSIHPQGKSRSTSVRVHCPFREGVTAYQEDLAGGEFLDLMRLPPLTLLPRPPRLFGFVG